MPVVVEKEIIAPGDYHTAEGLVRATPRRIRHWLESGNRMLGKRLQVPLPWEHQDDAKPAKAGDRLAARCKQNAGFLRGYFLDKDGHLWGELELPDRETADYVKDHVKFV